MPRITLTGNKVVYVSEDKAKRIYDKWTDNSTERLSVVDLGLEKFITLSQIKGIDFDREPVQSEVEKKTEDRIEKIREWNRQREAMKGWDAEKKARHMLKTGALLYYCSKMNKSPISVAIYDKVMIRLIDYFDKNPKEIWAGAEIYQDLIPQGTLRVKNEVGDFKSIGEAMASPGERKTTVNVMCDQCNKKFEAEEDMVANLSFQRICPRCANPATLFNQPEKVELDFNL